MKIYRTFTFTLALAAMALLAGCKQKLVEAAPIEESTMANLLHDAYLIEGYYTVATTYRFDTLQGQMARSYDSLFAKYEITPAEFDSSIAWYVRHYEDYQRVIDSVSARLAREADVALQKANDEGKAGANGVSKRELEIH